MSRISLKPLLWLAGFLLAGSAFGQVYPSTHSTTTPAAQTEAAPTEWSGNASIYAFLVPDSRDYVNPNLVLDRGWLHLEARYNYEALDTGSIWVGYKFSAGEKLTFEITPMLGGVFGDLTGVAPGYNFALGYGRFELASQGEYVVDVNDSAGNFFYTWTELTYSPWDWLRVGLAIQRTKLYKTDLDIQRGFLVGASYKKVDFNTYVFNLGWTDPTFVFAAGCNF